MVRVAVKRRLRCRSASPGIKLSPSQNAETSMSAIGKCVVAPCSLDQMEGSGDMTRSAAQGGVDDRERMRHFRVADRSKAEIAAQLFRRDRHRARFGCGAGRGLRKGSGTGGVKGDVALDLLHGLMDVTVQHRD